MPHSGQKSPNGSELADRIRKVTHAEPSSHAVHGGRPVIDGRGGHPDREPTFADGTVETAPGVREHVAVRDVSGDGVRIEFACTLTLPDRVLLSAPGMGLLRRWARVVWRDHRAAGLQLEPRT